MTEIYDARTKTEARSYALVLKPVGDDTLENAEVGVYDTLNDLVSDVENYLGGAGEKYVDEEMDIENETQFLVQEVGLLALGETAFMLLGSDEDEEGGVEVIVKRVK